MELYFSDVIKTFNDAEIDFKHRSSHFPQQDNLPDGAYYIKEVNKKRLRYNLQINDLKYWHHRNNGITMIGVYDDSSRIIFFNLRTVEGSLAIADIINQAYMRELFNDTIVIGGVQFYPFKMNFD
jgi:hypothetical protein